MDAARATLAIVLSDIGMPKMSGSSSSGKLACCDRRSFFSRDCYQRLWPGRRRPRGAGGRFRRTRVETGLARAPEGSDRAAL